jgi:hypothetical protein
MLAPLFPPCHTGPAAAAWCGLLALAAPAVAAGPTPDPAADAAAIPQAALLPVPAASIPPVAWIVAALLVLFLFGAGYLVHALGRGMQAQRAAEDESLAARLAELPLGAPEGTVRALLSVFIIVFGFLLLAFSRQLDLGSGEALTGFMGAVISFYFASRSQEGSRQVASAAASAAQRASEVAAGVASAAHRATEAANSAAWAASRATEVIGALRHGAAAGPAAAAGEGEAAS